MKNREISAYQRGPWLKSIVLLGGLCWLACGEIPTTDEEPRISAGRGGSASGGSAGAGGSRRNDEAAVLGTDRDDPPAREDAGAQQGPNIDAEPDEPEPDDEGSPFVAGPYCDAISIVFQYRCGPSCHLNAGFKSGDFALGMDEARAYINRISARGEHCGLMIDPNNPSKSLILTKITAEYPIGQDCGQPMPVGSIEITGSEIACVANWLEQFRE